MSSNGRTKGFLGTADMSALGPLTLLQEDWMINVEKDEHRAIRVNESADVFHGVELHPGLARLAGTGTGARETMERTDLVRVLL